MGLFLGQPVPDHQPVLMPKRYTDPDGLGDVETCTDMFGGNDDFNNNINNNKFDRGTSVPSEPPREAPNRTIGGFYSTSNNISGDTAPMLPGLIEERPDQQAKSISKSEYMFPPPFPTFFPTPPKLDQKSNLPPRQSSLSEMPTTSINVATPPSSLTGLGPNRGFKFRSHSISVTDPVCRSAYESIAQSPAASFLAQFAQADSWKRRPTIEDGSILDRYRVGRIIGRGSFSECREASYADEQEAEGEDKPVGDLPKLAMKIVRSDEEQGHNLEEFDRELSIWQRLRHRNILPLIDCLRLDNAVVAISPIAENGTLLEYISKHRPFTEEEAKPLFRQICEAIAHLHHDQCIVHRDIKLDNILLDGQLRPFICDFGLSECIDPSGIRHPVPPMSSLFDEDQEFSETTDTSRTRTEDEIFCKGSLWYLPPEELEPSLLKDDQGHSKLSDIESRMKGDIWSLGVVLYAMVTGKLPFMDDFIPRLHVAILSADYPRLSSSFSSELCDLMNRLLTVDISQRPSINTVLLHSWFK